MNLRELKSKKILYPRNLFMDITDETPTDEKLEALLFAVEKLNADEKEILRLRYIQKQAVTAVAKRLGISWLTVCSRIQAALDRLNSPMLFNYIRFGINKWDKIASLTPAERIAKISSMEGKPVGELDISYFELPQSVYAALSASHILREPYTAADAMICVCKKPCSKLICESDRLAAEEVLKICGVLLTEEPPARSKSVSKKAQIGYPRNLYISVFGETCPTPDSDMIKCLEKAVGEAPQPGGQILTLLYKKGLTYRVIANQLGLSIEMVRQHENRALRYLRRANVRRALRYGAVRSNRLNRLKANPEKALREPLERIMTASSAAELAEIGVHTLAEAKLADLSGCSATAAYEISDILAFLEI